jgi:GntR family transcriptional regulator
MVESHKPARGRRRNSSDVSLEGSRALDRNSIVPLYFQLGAALKEIVDMAAWQPGARFPTEREISEKFDVSRTVIRRALDLLEGEGGITRIRGKGTFVAPPRRKVEALGVVRALLTPPDGLSLSVLAAQEELPDEPVAHFLEMEGRPTPIAHVTAVMRVNDCPVCLVESYSSTSLVPWLLPAAQALRAGAGPPEPGRVDLGTAKVSVELTFFGWWGGPQLGASAGEPALQARLIQYGSANESRRERPLEFAYLICRSDNAQFAVEG